MKEKRVIISYCEMKLDAIAQSSKGEKSIEELLTESVDDLFKKTVPKDVQNFLNVMQGQKSKSKPKADIVKPESELPKPTIPAPVSPSGGHSPSNSGVNGFPKNSGN